MCIYGVMVRVLILPTAFFIFSAFTVSLITHSFLDYIFILEGLFKYQLAINKHFLQQMSVSLRI